MRNVYICQEWKSKKVVDNAKTKTPQPLPFGHPEESFEEQLYFRLTRLNVIIITTFLFSLFLVVQSPWWPTPTREYIPGYASTK